MNSDSLTEPKLSALYHAFRATRRRLVIKLLSERPAEQFTTRSLSREIAAIEEDITSAEATGEPYRNVYNSLTQTHLPTLGDLEVIIYESERQSVSPGPRFEDALLMLATDTAALEALEQSREAYDQ